MATLAPGQSTLAELSDDEGYGLVVGGPSQQLDNSRVSAMYLRRHGDELHEALDVSVNPTTYSESRGRMEVLRTPNIKAALDVYRKENADVPFDVFNCSWDELFDQMARAQGDHETRTSKKGNLFKYLWRKAGTKHDAIEPWLHLIPDEYGLSILRGAIGIVFHMAEKSHEREKAILEGFEAITETIHNAMSKGVSFQREPEMHACCQALYDCLLDGVADLIWSLKPDGKGKTLLGRIKNKQEKQKSINIDALLKRVQKKSTELDQCAERITAKKARETHQGVDMLRREAGVTRALVVDVKAGQSDLLEVARQTNDDVRLVGRGVQFLGATADNLARTCDTVDSTMRQGVEALLLYLRQDRAQMLSATESQNAAIDLMAEVVRNLDQNQSHIIEAQTQLIREMRRSLTPVPDNAQTVIPPDVFLDLFGVPPKLANDDLHTALTHGTRFSRLSQQQAQSLLATEEFGRWLHSNASEVLLVDGNDPSATRGLVSPMSLLCATLSSALERSRSSASLILLHFFCGLHVSSGADAHGPMGMMRALLVQLAVGLLTLDMDLEFNFGSVPGEFCDDVRAGLPEALFCAFSGLLNLVPRGVTVFCFIDGVSAFEDDRFEEDLVAVVDRLERRVASDRGTLKILYTCPYRSILLAPREYIDQRDYVLLEAGGRGGFGRVSDRSVRNLISGPG